jgi:hypothetical protein
LVKNGHNQSGSQQYHCKACDAYLVLEPDKGYSDEEKERILRAYRERGSMRAIERICGVSRNTLSRWLKKRGKKGHEQPGLSATVEPAKEGDVLPPTALDEAWSYVGQKADKRWIWTAMCRRTRQIVAFVIGDRSAETCATQEISAALGEDSRRLPCLPELLGLLEGL